MNDPKSPDAPQGSTENTTHEPLVKWEAKFAIGIPEIDEQHQQIFALVNKLHEVVKTGNRPANFVTSVLKELADYVKYHFSFEEQLFINSKYPRVDEHRAAHRAFGKQVDVLVEESHKSIVDLHVILRFVTGWLIEHIEGSDMDIASYIAEYKV